MKNNAAQNLTAFLKNYWKVSVCLTLLGSSALSIIKTAQYQESKKPKQENASTISTDSLKNFILDSLFQIRFKPNEPETIGSEFFIFKEAPDYKNLEAITKDYPKAKNYIPIVQEAIEANKDVFPLDAVLVLGKIKAESGFERFAISRVGAAGPSQLMPSTAQGYKLKVYYPDYLKQAEILNKEANELYKRAISLFTSKEFELAKITYLDYEKKRKKADSLFSYYKKDLLSKVKGKPDSIIKEIDERFILDKAIQIGANYLALMFRKFEGDVRMGISAYNCGPEPVSKVKGIPYIKETIYYQNEIINFWKKYHKMCLEKPKEEQELYFK